MFTSTVATGERVALWSPGGVEPEPMLRVLLPGEGESGRAQAATARFVPSVQQASRPGRTTKESRRRVRGGSSSAGPGRPTKGRRSVVLPGDPSPTDTARAVFLGHHGGVSSETDRESARRLGVTPGVTEVGHALIELGCWRTHVVALPPGPELVAALAARPDALAPAPVTDPDTALATAVTARNAELSQRVVTGWANAVLESVTARNRVLSWLQAEQYTDLAMLSRNYPGLAEMLPTELAFALRCTESAAGSAISTARAFAIRLPGTLHALHQGLIDVDHAVAVARATGTTTAEVAGQVENDVLGEVTSPGSSTTPEQLRRKTARRVIARDPDGAADRHRAAAKDRLMTRWAEDDGMAGLRVIAPAQQIAAIWEASTAMADAAKTPGDTRNLGARRVDTLTDICTHILNGTIGIIPSNESSSAATGGTADGPAVNDPAVNDTAVNDPAANGPAVNDTAVNDTAVNDTAVASDHAGTATATDDVDATSDCTRDTDAGPADIGVDRAAAIPTSGDPQSSDDINAEPNTCTATTTHDDGDQPDGTSQTDIGNSTIDSCATPTSRATNSSAPPTLLPVPVGSRHGRKPHIQVVVPYTVLLGANDPCELVGHGTITADQARLIIADGTLQRLLCDPASGIVLDYGRTRYHPPDTLKHFLIARDGTCRSPGCTQPADRCETDHVIAYRPGQPTGGRTDHTLLDLKCKHHHRAKDGGGFNNTRDPDGTSHWTTPLGRHYTRPPHTVWHPTNTNNSNTNNGNANNCNAQQNEPDWADRFPPPQPAKTDQPQPGQPETSTTTTPDDEPPPF